MGSKIELIYCGVYFDRNLNATENNEHLTSWPFEEYSNGNRHRSKNNANMKCILEWVKKCDYFEFTGHQPVFKQNRWFFFFFPYLHRASTVSKTLFTVPTDAHYHKIIEMLKQHKNYNICSDMFRFTQEPSSGSSPVLC